MEDQPTVVGSDGDSIPDWWEVMPTVWSAGAHDTKVHLSSSSGSVKFEIRCKCGWSLELPPEVWKAPGEQWRDFAAAHVAQSTTKESDGGD